MINKEPKISVISACFNHGRFINEMLESVYNQTFEDYEIIIVNDGSTDNTADILQRITDERVRIVNTENHGPASARNTAIKLAGAPIILNLDADDRIAPTYLEKAYKIFYDNPDAGIVHCDAECFGARPGKFEIGDYSLELMVYGNRINSQSFFRKEDWHSAGGYSGELKYGLEDWDFWLCIIELGRKVIRIPEKLVYYRTYENLHESRSGRRKLDRLKIMESYIIILRRHQKLISRHPIALKKFAEIERKFKKENSFIRSVKKVFNRQIQKYIFTLRNLFAKFQ